MRFHFCWNCTTINVFSNFTIVNRKENRKKFGLASPVILEPEMFATSHWLFEDDGGSSYHLYFEVKHTLTQKVGDVKDAGCLYPPLSRPERGVRAGAAWPCSHRDCAGTSREEAGWTRPGTALCPAAACRPSPGLTGRIIRTCLDWLYLTPLTSLQGSRATPRIAGSESCLLVWLASWAGLTRRLDHIDLNILAASAGMARIEAALQLLPGLVSPPLSLSVIDTFRYQSHIVDVIIWHWVAQLTFLSWHTKSISDWSAFGEFYCENFKFCLTFTIYMGINFEIPRYHL